jgi:predicted dehydrogenase
MTLMGGIPLRAEDKTATGDAVKPGASVNCGIIGLGPQGRELLTTLCSLPNAPVLAVCDTYEPMLNRARQLAPHAEPCTDYRQILANKSIQAVLVATPTHRHREIVVEALKAGKHVYCEAPLANTIEDARAIAQAARAALRVNFQTGLHSRADEQHAYVLKYIQTGDVGRIAKIRTQWARKSEWRRSSPNPDREKDLNWRLDKQVSTGLAGEIGIHQLDVASWYLHARPLAATGYSSIQQWTEDNREVGDTVQAVVEYPGKVNLIFDATLTSSFDASCETITGTYATIVFQIGRASCRERVS